jgi:uncharacterized coiled-coil DUF342 family protein
MSEREKEFEEAMKIALPIGETCYLDKVFAAMEKTIIKLQLENEKLKQERDGALAMYDERLRKYDALKQRLFEMQNAAIDVTKKHDSLKSRVENAPKLPAYQHKDGEISGIVNYAAMKSDEWKAITIYAVPVDEVPDAE